MKNRILSIVLFGFALFMIASCGKAKQTEDKTENAGTKTLVLYYSQTGATKAVAEQLQALLGADIEAVEASQPYDGTYEETIKRCMTEREELVVPKINSLKSDISRYDTIFVGYPIWFGTYARPIIGLLEACDFDGKTVVPFCTFGSGGLEASSADLKDALPKANIVEGYGVRNARIGDMPDELKAFLVNNGYIAGQAEQLPDYSGQEPVTDSDAEIFNKACGDYQFPLGTPVTVGKRTTSRGTDYKYTVKSKVAQGEDVDATIYVTMASGAAPVFTKVVR